MQTWEDSQLSCQKALQTIFFEADDNGDGILQLDEFYAMIRERKPNMTDAEAFVIYDEALALSEQMLGYESDAILADAFTRTAIGHNLFSEIAQPLKTADEAGDDPPPKWGLAPGGKRGAGDAKGGANPLVQVSEKASYEVEVMAGEVDPPNCYLASGAQSDLVWAEPCPDAPGTKTTKGAALHVWL